MLNSQVTTAQHMEREKAYDIVSEFKYYTPSVRKKECYYYGNYISL